MGLAGFQGNIVHFPQVGRGLGGLQRGGIRLMLIKTRRNKERRDDARI